MKFKNKLSPKAMVTVDGITYRAIDYVIDTGSGKKENKRLTEFLSKNSMWHEHDEKAEQAEAKQAEESAKAEADAIEAEKAALDAERKALEEDRAALDETKALLVDDTG